MRDPSDSEALLPRADRIPDAMAAEVLAEAARLYAESKEGYSLTDLERACMEAQIPSHIVWEAIRNVQEKRSRSRQQNRSVHHYMLVKLKHHILPLPSDLKGYAAQTLACLSVLQDVNVLLMLF